MSPEEYIRDRLDDQITWYDKKSQFNQKWFKRFRVVEIVFATSIPFLVSYITNDTNSLKIIVGAMGVCVAALSGLVTLYKFQENRIEYRTVAETLKHEKFLYLTKSAPYDKADAFHPFVERVEAIISKENTNWANITREKRKEKPHG
jgi:hypothetical protein